jgi:hypothetical protein
MNGAPMRTVGRYDLLEVIGRGGAAVVYLAHQRDLRRRVALKELAPFQAAADPMFAGRFAEESRVAGSLSHPNIVTVHEYFEHDGIPYIAMEYLSQGSLRTYVGKLTVAQIAGVLEGVLAGLAHGQAHSVVHRDLKPENLLVTADGRVKIADFGVARAYADAVTRQFVTAVGTTIGTPAYMAPEQALGHELGPAADLYSLGIVAWELLIGRVPFEEKDTPVAVLYRHVHEPIPSARSVAPGVDPRIDAWLERMLAKDPADRFPGAEAAWEELEDVVLELLGPRWRRDARLPVIETGVADRPLTPALFAEGSAAAEAQGGDELAAPEAELVPAEALDGDAPGGGGPGGGASGGGVPGGGARSGGELTAAGAAPTLDGVPTPDPDSRVAAVPAPGSRMTIHRLARRHDAEKAAPEAPSKQPVSRVVAIAAILAAIVAAGGLGVLLGSGGNSRAPAPRAKVTLSPAVQAAELVTVLKSVVAAGGRSVKRLDDQRTATAQASAAVAVERLYRGGVKQLGTLPPTTRNAAQTQSIDATLGSLTRLYGSLAAAARARRKARYASAGRQIASAERTLRDEIKALA